MDRYYPLSRCAVGLLDWFHSQRPILVERKKRKIAISRFSVIIIDFDDILDDL